MKDSAKFEMNACGSHDWQIFKDDDIETKEKWKYRAVRDVQPGSLWQGRK
jgi:hypothetical protein